jgi:hypothetical protein
MCTGGWTEALTHGSAAAPLGAEPRRGHRLARRRPGAPEGLQRVYAGPELGVEGQQAEPVDGGGEVRPRRSPSPRLGRCVSEQEIGKKMVEEMDLDHFSGAYYHVTGRVPPERCWPHGRRFTARVDGHTPLAGGTTVMLGFSRDTGCGFLRPTQF